MTARIDDTLASGGQVFVAGHLLDSAMYDDLTGVADPFAAFVHRRYTETEGLALYRNVARVLEVYKVGRSDFSIGPDEYFLLERN